MRMHIKVRVETETRRETCTEVSADHFKISVKEPAERNLANKRVIELIAKHLKIPVARVLIKSGHRSPSKILTIR